MAKGMSENYARSLVRSDTELNRLWLELERRRMQREQSASEQRARAWAELTAAFGQADVAGVGALGLERNSPRTSLKTWRNGLRKHRKQAAGNSRRAYIT